MKHIRLIERLRNLRAYGCCLEAATALEKIQDDSTDIATAARRYAEVIKFEPHAWGQEAEIARAFEAGAKFALGES